MNQNPNKNPKSKNKLRIIARKTLSNLSPREHQQLSGELVEFLASYLKHHFPNALRIASYASLPNEPQLDSLKELLPTRQFLYPLLGSEDEINFYQVTDLDTLVPGSFGIREPDPQRHAPVTPDDIDLILVPGLSFDLMGHRLGQGKGCYDRFLTRVSTTPTIGISYHSQLVPHLPSEPHDRPVNYLATNRAIIPV